MTPTPGSIAPFRARAITSFACAACPAACDLDSAGDIAVALRCIRGVGRDISKWEKVGHKGFGPETEVPLRRVACEGAISGGVRRTYVCFGCGFGAGCLLVTGSETPPQDCPLITSRCQWWERVDPVEATP